MINKCTPVGMNSIIQYPTCNYQHINVFFVCVYPLTGLTLHFSSKRSLVHARVLKKIWIKTFKHLDFVLTNFTLYFYITVIRINLNSLFLLYNLNCNSASSLLTLIQIWQLNWNLKGILKSILNGAQPWYVLIFTLSLCDARSFIGFRFVQDSGPSTHQRSYEYNIISIPCYKIR